MKMYLPFGDWSDDGHGKYTNVLIEAPSMEQLRDAQDKIKEIYGEDFFDNFAQEYEEPFLGKKIWDALITTDYPIDKFIELDEYNNWEGMKSLDQVLAKDSNPYVSFEFVADAFIWLLNAYGAEIKLSDEDIPMICNWTCPGFETVGYGCFF